MAMGCVIISTPDSTLSFPCTSFTLLTRSCVSVRYPSRGIYSSFTTPLLSNCLFSVTSLVYLVSFSAVPTFSLQGSLESVAPLMRLPLYPLVVQMAEGLQSHSQLPYGLLPLVLPQCRYRQRWLFPIPWCRRLFRLSGLVKLRVLN